MRIQLTSELLISVLLVAQAFSFSLEAPVGQTHDVRDHASANDASAASLEQIVYGIETGSEPSTKGPVDGLDVTITVDENPLVKDRTYGVIVDCGSSGTRVHIYHWNNELSYSELLHHIEPLRNQDGSPVTTKINKPLTILENTPQNASVYFKPILDFITSKIPVSRHEFTGIYIMATAGMRLLDLDTQKSIMFETKKYIENNFPFPLVTTSVISGAAEGMYQWISVNAKEGRFLTKDTDTKIRTLGIIEMGGASIQVTYRLHSGAKELIMDRLPRSIHGSYLAQIRRPEMSRTKQIHGAMDMKSPKKSGLAHGLADRSKQVFSNFKQMGSVRGKSASPPRSARDERTQHDHLGDSDASDENNEEADDHDYVLHSTTFLGFGSRSARDATIDLLVKQHARKFSLTRLWKKFVHACFMIAGDLDDHRNDPKMIIEDPCLPEGHEENVQRPSRMLLAKNQTIGFSLDEDDHTFEVKLKGTSNYNKCRHLVETMLSTARKERLNCEPRKPCTMDLLGENFVPFEGAGSYMSFVALSDFHYTASIMLNRGGTYRHDPIVDKTREICNSDLDTLKREYPEIAGNDKLKDRITSECFKAVWMDTFLVKGLKMPKDTLAVETKGKIKNDDPEWTLGAVLDKSLSIEKASERGLESRQMLDPKFKPIRNLGTQKLQTLSESEALE